ncbi:MULTISPECIES: YgiQ family radical SAM protein [Comamonas]|uniref:YgiQ family radical SAM protein n=1 Tax=Comamonas TaxID=283 RepID=UPI00050F79C7|nr:MULTISPECIES: YgiQ family radical SAM protein [Comamonas]KGG93606.1 radical SAM protein [Comamonas thiooxydans]KGG98850.1 radical SAM protein [Comamonas thiooxydans]KGH05173.1 radical SAM protein [Comamonas thiooxydans]KGH14303.1 radical SAM protein [Comamonas thiooxydans]TZG06980.1 YgiQ family radical SAM protein [Comamonas thiooxydans]
MNAPVDVSFFHRDAKPLTSYKPYWAKRFGPAPFLPMSRAEMDQLGWDSCDIILVTGDAYVDHPSFGMAVIGRVLEAQGFRVGIIAQPDWTSAEAFKALGKPNLFWGVTAGNMDSMINRYTADRKIRSDDAYTPGDVAGKRPDRAAIVYCQRCREAYKDVPIVLGGIEGSLRRIAHYDYWSDKVRRSIVVDSKCDILLYGNAERALVEVAHRIAAREPVEQITDVRGTSFFRRASEEGWFEVDSTTVDEPGEVEPHINPYMTTSEQAEAQGQSCSKEDAAKSEADGPNGGASVAKVQPIQFVPNLSLRSKSKLPPRERTVLRLPSYEEVKSDQILYAHANRVLHLETNPGNARALVQAHGEGTTARDVWMNPPPIPLTTAEMDWVFGLPYARSPHPAYADESGSHEGATKIPAWEMIRTSVNIMRGCFGGCTFCSITEHEGRIIQSRSEDSIIQELEEIRDKVKGFTGTISDLGGPTANMYRLGCKSPQIEAACRKPSCVFPGICQNLHTDHGPLIKIYRRARKLPGIKKILIGSGLRYDLAVKSPEYVKELVQHHVGGYLKIAPEHTEQGPLTKMMKPGIGSYDKFKQLFEKFSEEAGKKQFLIPYFIAAHPGTSDEDMMNLAIWLKKNGFRADQVQTFYPSPMATATAMYHSGRNTLTKVRRQMRDEAEERVDIVRGEKRRRLHKAFLRYHDPNNWPLLREALKTMGRADLIGNGKQHLIPTFQPLVDGSYQSARKKNSTSSKAGGGIGYTTNKDGKAVAVRRRSEETSLEPKGDVRFRSSQPQPGKLLTQHTGLPPRAGVTGKAKPGFKTAARPAKPAGQGSRKPR